MDDPEMLKFTHLLMEAKSKYSPNIKPYLRTHDILDSVDGYSHIAVNYNILPPVKIKTKPAIFIMRRKPNIKYDPLKVKIKRSVNLPILNENLEENFLIPNEDLQKMEPIFDDIMESLEEIGKPLEIVNLNILEVSEQFELNDIKNKTDFSSEIEIKEDIILKEQGEPAEIKSEENVKMEKEIEIEDEAENLSQENSNELVVDKSPEVKDESREFKSQEKFDVVKPIAKEKPSEKVNGKRNGKINTEQQKPGSIKEAVKKMIQEKMELKAKKEIPDVEEKLLKEKKIEKLNQERINQEKLVPLEKVIEPEKLSQPRSEKKHSQEKEIIRQDSKKIANVKESIRKIIDQFKEFEKDFTSEDQDILQPDSDSDNFEEELSIEESAFHIEEMDSTILAEAKESLKEIIDQFKELKSELTSEEDDQFDEIAANYMDRPISETLMNFSEALKNLVQRMKAKAENIEEAKKKIGNSKISRKATANENSNFPKVKSSIDEVREEIAQKTKVSEKKRPNNKNA